jgi:hypothetical protein
MVQIRLVAISKTIFSTLASKTSDDLSSKIQGGDWLQLERPLAPISLM